jgi:tRNA (guanine9-N1)-methyltransferase
VTLRGRVAADRGAAWRALASINRSSESAAFLARNLKTHTTITSMDSEERPAKLRKLEHEEGARSDMDIATASTMSEQAPLATAGSEEASPTKETPNGEQDAPKMSKSALKKKRKLDEWEAGREDRKVIRKEKARERKARTREAWKAENPPDENGNVPKPPPSRVPKGFAGNGTQVPITIIFDCDFEDLMYEQELKSLGLQITRCYSDNRKAKYKTHLAVSSFGGKMKERFDGILAQQYTSWKGFQFFEEDFVAVAEKSKEWMTGPQGGKVAGALLEANTHSVEQNDALPTEEAAEEGEIVYLSSESDNILTHLKPNSTYIIGGLVDKNRHKGVCHRRAVNRNIKTAKLPIKEFLDMRDRQVLVTNHVLEILLKWMEFGDWGKAFMDVIPQRKGGKLRENENGGSEDPEDGPVPEDQGNEEKVDAAHEAEHDAEVDAEGVPEVPETEVIEVTKGLPVGETEAD